VAINPVNLAKVLLDNKLIKEKLLKSLIGHSKTQGKSLEDLLFEREIISDDKLGEVIADQYGVPFVKVTEKTISEPLLRIIPYALASHQFVIPFESNGSEISVALYNPHNYELRNFIEKKTGLTVIPFYSTKKEIKSSLKAYNRDINEKFNKLLKTALEDPTKIESLKDAAKILDTIIYFAYQNTASDIHIEPQKDFIVVRYRIDGMLQTIAELPMEIAELLTTRIKVLANLRTDEHRAAQDGRFKIDLEDTEITMRVSIIPTYEGEKTVLRLLSSTVQELNLESLGYSDQNLKTIHENMLKTHGLILMTGPTGSGKTTTLYSMLKLLNSPEVNVSTIEDPIEYKLEGVNQIQVNAKTNITFAKGLRALLRQDPDIMMVGEIRDEETAGISINSALTGHLVLATLHTNDAASTLPRMLEMGIEAFLLSATVKMVISQRLVRKICPKCKEAFKMKMEELVKLGDKFKMNKDFKKIIEEIYAKNPQLQAMLSEGEVTIYKGKGCSKCSATGYKGRTSISEVMEISENLKGLLLKNPSPKELEDAAIKEGMTGMFVDGITKVIEGSTTLEEVLRVMRT
jgi:type II secretory ATPase GspE/PulE/Tfp pilus assembly ATPase PilB-like protein